MDGFFQTKSLVGGVLIGVSASAMLLLHGRVTGITGILHGALFQHRQGEGSWRWLFLLGLVGGGALMAWLLPDAFPQRGPTPLWLLVTAGLLVGFGTRMGSGCTSGHGVCGVSRLSPRSLVATTTFIVVGMLAVAIARHVSGAGS